MIMNNEEARKLFHQSGISYSDIGSKEIAQLIKYVKTELIKTDSELNMKLCRLRKNDVSYKDDGSIKNCYLMVDGSYFKRREAISFNTQNIKGEEFIGFAGWADDKNVKPFIDGFVTWLRNMGK